ncbi:LysR family transcriptional regulator [Paracoccus saliphilus]|uniref:DNA-binding transcriptional regulator, LysR family n=1 Tax=Paracoccus saliphilus TaxID=405559 RepID=A0AA45W521_9RHOB|nr:LysR family transcriptional regulator [Paracoccus saliphilus]WCR02130.1 LysR family transcriptional regulator [Paracoccus saliphilus]SIS90329.1 DNA-binding transcriptional regulator, LysR family [Paracoccus saliphilus]
MNTRFLQSFIMVADCGSIAEAARRLNLTPAAVAQRLRALEDDLGHDLVVRAGSTVQPTEEGLAILENARTLVQGARDLRAIAARGVPAGQLRLGATASAMTGILPAVIAELSTGWPDIEYFVQPGSSQELYHQVIRGELDAALIVKPSFSIPKSVDWKTVRDEPLVLIGPADIPKGEISSLLGRFRFIRYDRNQWGGHIVDQYLRKNNLTVQEWLELDALDAIAAMVDRGLGISIVPDWAPPWPTGLQLSKRPLAGGQTRQTGILWNRAGARIAAVNAFVGACAKMAPLPLRTLGK